MRSVGPDVVVIPPRLRAGSRIAVSSPSRSIGVKRFGEVAIAKRLLESKQLVVMIDWAGAEPDRFYSSPVAERTSQLQAALSDDQVDGVITSTGGWNAIDVLEGLDFAALAEVRPKVVCGMSDITVLTTALFARLGWQTYYGPNLATFAEGPKPRYTLESFWTVTAGAEDSVVHLLPTKWFGEVRAEGETTAYKRRDPGMRVVSPGRAEGRIFGGNLGTLFLLQGTDYWPDGDGDVVLFIEEDDLAGRFTLIEALRRIQSLLLQPGLRGRVRGLVMGRFQKGAEAPIKTVVAGIRTISALRDIPVVINAPFGHTNPTATLPIGGHAWLDANAESVTISVSCRKPETGAP